MIVIGITGGMASGKSTLAHMFAGRGIFHFDADKMVHHLLQHDRSTIADIAQHFPTVIRPSPQREASPAGPIGDMPQTPPPQPSPSGGGSIDRAALAALISRQPEHLATLEHILHPRVREAELAFIQKAQRRRARAVILDIPLLFETDAHTLCDITLVAHAPLHQRQRRAFQRPGMTDEKWRRLLDRQLTDRARNAQADIVIPTSLGKAATRRMVKQLMHQWKL